VTAPSLRRRLACNVYESLLLAAVVLVAALPIAVLAHYLPPEVSVATTRILLLLAIGAYLVMFWRKGQTLAMKTWRIRLVAAAGGPPGLRQVWLRFLLSCLNLALLGIGWWAAAFRADRQFLQDHYAGTRLERY
jgi:uncharacterized RDD family membrane protein YckC